MRLPRPMVVGFCAGCAVLPAAYVGAPVSRGDDAQGIDIRVTTAPTGEVGTTGGAIVDRHGLEPGQRVSGERVVRNQTGEALMVSVRAVRGARELDNLFQVDIGVDDRPLFSGSLGRLRAPTERSFRLRPGQSRRLRVGLRVDGQAGERWRGRAEDIHLELLPRRRHD